MYYSSTILKKNFKLLVLVAIKFEHLIDYLNLSKICFLCRLI